MKAFYLLLDESVAGKMDVTVDALAEPGLYHQINRIGD